MKTLVVTTTTLDGEILGRKEITDEGMKKRLEITVDTTAFDAAVKEFDERMDRHYKLILRRMMIDGIRSSIRDLNSIRSQRNRKQVN